MNRLKSLVAYVGIVVLALVIAVTPALVAPTKAATTRQCVRHISTAHSRGHNCLPVSDAPVCLSEFELRLNTIPGSQGWHNEVSKETYRWMAQKMMDGGLSMDVTFEILMSCYLAAVNN
jgi:hypothetical protein